MPHSWKSKFAAVLVALVGTAGVGGASAQDYAFGWNPRSGDAWVDTWLGDVNRYGMRYRDPFVDEMVRYYGAPRDLITTLMVDRHWAPGDVYFACSLASIIGRPCRYVADVWERDHAQGWGEVAKGLGIKPGSPEFHRLKKGFVPSYDRWGRAITLDSELERDYPGRGKGVQSGKGQGKPSPSQGHGNAGKGDAGGQGKSQGGSKGNGQDKGQGKGQGNNGKAKGHG